MQEGMRRGEHLVITYYERATDVKGFEYGKVYIVVNGKLVHEDRSQWDDGRYPIHAFPWMPRRGHALPHAWMSDLTEVQARVNQCNSLTLTHLGLLANPNILIPKGSGLPQQLAFNFRVYYYNTSAGPPTFWSPPAPSTAVMQMGERAQTDLDRVGGTFPFARGEHQQGIPSGFYAQLLIEQDNAEIGPVVRRHAEAWEKCGEAIIDLHRSYDSPERMLAVVGTSHRTQLVAFSRDQLPAKLSLVVQESSLQTYSPAARITQAKELAQQGFFGAFADQPQVRKALLEFIRLPDITEIDTGEALLLRAIDEIHTRLVEEGQPIQVPAWAADEPMILATLQAAVRERAMREDSWSWDGPTTERVVAYKQSLDQAAQALQEQAAQAEEDAARRQMKVQAEGETIKSGLRKSERATQEIVKVGANLIADNVGGAKPKSSENGGPPPKEASDGG
jgi:hypothetical protein